MCAKYIVDTVISAPLGHGPPAGDKPGIEASWILPSFRVDMPVYGFKARIPAHTFVQQGQEAGPDFDEHCECDPADSYRRKGSFFKALETPFSMHAPPCYRKGLTSTSYT